VGAVAVLFLFVVMMLDIDFVELKQGFLSYVPGGALIALALLAEIGIVAAAANFGGPETFRPNPGAPTNAEALSNVLYTDYLLLFQMSGIVLLVAMMGAIVLTLRHRPSVKRQNISDQVARTKETAMEVRQVRPGQGI
jgi:NADH-quinone oxidoreductase subunit J